MLVEYLYPMVIRIVRRNLPSRASEEDLAQGIFVKMFENLDKFEGAVTLEHWVARIAVNHCLNAIRAQKSRPEWRLADLSEEQAAALETVTNTEAQAPDPAHLLGARELVEKLLGGLSPEDGLLMRLLEMDGYSVDEVRQVTGWSAVAIRVRAFRARGKLNKQFKELRKKGQL